MIEKAIQLMEIIWCGILLIAIVLCCLLGYSAFKGGDNEDV